MENELNLFASRHQGWIREFEAGSEVFADRSALDCDYLMLEGRILELVSDENTDKQASTLLYRPGDIIGPLGENPQKVPHTKGRATTHVVAIRIPEEKLMSLFSKDKSFREMLLRSLVQMLHRMEIKFYNTAIVSPPKRVIAFIVKTSQRAQSPVIKMTTKELAQAVSTTRQTVSKVLSQLKKEHLIETKYSTIEVLDVNKIKENYLNK